MGGELLSFGGEAGGEYSRAYALKERLGESEVRLEEGFEVCRVGLRGGETVGGGGELLGWSFSLVVYTTVSCA